MANLCTSPPFGFHISWYLWYQTFTASKKSYHCQGWLYSRFPLSHACPCSPLTMSVPSSFSPRSAVEETAFLCLLLLQYGVMSRKGNDIKSHKEYLNLLFRTLFDIYLRGRPVVPLNLWARKRWLKAQSVFAVKILFSLYVLKKNSPSLRGGKTLQEVNEKMHWEVSLQFWM